MSTILILTFFIAILGTVYAFINYFLVAAVDEGTEEMRSIAVDIRTGANAFLIKEYKVLILVVIVVAVIEAVMFFPPSGFALIIGATFSSLTGLLGMQASTHANVRVANTALTTGSIGKSQKLGLRGGCVMGLSVASFSLVGIVILYLCFGYDFLYNIETQTNWLGVSYTPMSIIFSSYGLGCSMVAMFFRVGGGIFTKAADMGADLVGKTELMIDEDDPRNPAVIADCVGDNVGDTAGLGSDLLESNVGAIVSAAITPIFIFLSFQSSGLNLSKDMMKIMIEYPIGFSAIGLLSCIIGLIFAFFKKDSDDPEKELDLATWVSAGCTGILNLIFTSVCFAGKDFGDLPFRFGFISPWLAALVGILSGIVIGLVTAYYTSDKYKPTASIAKASKMGVALNITQGISVSMKSILPSCLIIGIGVFLASSIAGNYGIAMAAVGMLSFVAITVSVDTYGPICDNAGGIAEMAKLPEDIRKITDKLDAVGNTKAAIGKGFAIGSAAYATISLLNSYMHCFVPVDVVDAVLNVLNPRILFGVIVGAAFIYFFSSMLIKSVTVSAEKMVEEVRRQFKMIPGLKEGFIIENGKRIAVKPDSKTCVEIATQDALKEMVAPALISIVVPVVGGFLFGPEFISGVLFGAILSAIMLAIFFGNSGGAWDNAKKSIEANGLKGSPEHIAAVVGDTVGDGFKDTAGPSLDIFIKIMNNVSLVFVNFFKTFYLL